MMRITEINKFKPLGSSIETLSHRFLQQCSVSGTAKGKGKVKGKESQALRKSKVTIKKGKKKEELSAEKGAAQLAQMASKCFLGPAPVRYLTPKQRKREAEREKMGLFSEARKQEIANAKKNQSKTNNDNDDDDDDDDDKPGLIGPEGYDLITLGLVDSDKIPKYKLTAEDGMKLAKEYSRFLMRKHRAKQAAEAALKKCKQEALEALPESLRAAAMVPDLTPLPANRIMACLTPPIEGYAEKMNEAAKRQNSIKGKVR